MKISCTSHPTKEALYFCKSCGFMCTPAEEEKDDKHSVILLESSHYQLIELINKFQNEKINYTYHPATIDTPQAIANTPIEKKEEAIVYPLEKVLDEEVLKDLYSKYHPSEELTNSIAVYKDYNYEAAFYACNIGDTGAIAIAYELIKTNTTRTSKMLIRITTQ